MNRFRTVTLSLLVVPAITFGANAPPEVMAAKESCANIEWSPAFLKKYRKRLPLVEK